jgi:hypothetical protein
MCPVGDKTMMGFEVAVLTSQAESPIWQFAELEDAEQKARDESRHKDYACYGIWSISDNRLLSIAYCGELYFS